MKNITVLGGGTGSFVVLSALKQFAGYDLAAIVAMTDSGGSTGKLRDQLGVLPPGDLRQCLVALSEAPEIWRKLFTYRFENGDFEGHNFGNLFLSALEKVSGSYDDVLDEAHYVMQCMGRVYPATFEHAHIWVKYNTGRIIESEKLLDEENPDGGVIIDAGAKPTPKAHKDAIERILDSDYIVAGPGDLYASQISIALTEGIPEAMKKSKAKVVYIMNLMTKSAQTKGYGAMQHLKDFAKFFGRIPEVCIVNTQPIPAEMLEKYRLQGEEPVKNDLAELGYEGKVVIAEMIDVTDYTASNGHTLASAQAHSIVRHDPNTLSRVLKGILT